MKKKILNILGAAVTVLLLYYLIKRSDPVLVGDTLRSADLRCVIWGAVLLGLNSLMLSFRIHTLFSFFEKKIPFVLTAKYYFTGLFFNQVLPTSAGGDAIKGYLMGKAAGSVSKGLLLTLVDRLIGLVTMALYLFAALVLGGYSFLPSSQNIILLSAMGVFIVLSVLIFSKRFSKKAYIFLSEKLKIKGRMFDSLKEAYKFFLETRKNIKVYLIAGIISLSSQILLILLAYIAAVGLGVTWVPLHYYFIIMPIIFVASMIPSIGGFGVREMLFVSFLSRAPYSVAPEQGLAISFLYILIFIALSLPGAFFYIFRKTKE